MNCNCSPRALCMKGENRRPLRTCTGLALLVLMAIAGCGRSLPPQTDSNRAHEALVKALETWRNGGTVESLRAASPAIYFNEPRCKGAARLIEYRIESEWANGLSWFCEVALTVETAGGQTVQGQTGYCIDTGAAIVIVPQTSS